MKKKIIISFILLLAVTLSLALPTFAEYDFNGIRVIDEADFMTQEDYETVYQKFRETSKRYGTELFIYTAKSEDEVSVSEVEDLADELYKKLFDNVTGKECVILYVVDDPMESDCAYIYTSGSKTRAAINNVAVQRLIENSLRGGGKSSRFVAYANECESLLARYEESGKEYKEPFAWFKFVIISLVIGFFIALIVVLVMKSKLKSVRMQNNATDYTVPDSMIITDERELYLYSTVVATPKPDDNDSSSSDSSSHGGGGGRI